MNLTDMPSRRHTCQWRHQRKHSPLP